MITCNKISLSFDGKTVFDNLNMHVSKGEHVCVQGASGKGKSTFLKLLQGYVLPSKGTLTINGHTLDSSSIRTIRKSMVWIPQNVNLPVVNGYELSKMMDISIQNSSVSELLMQLGLESDIIHKDFSKISGGQKQRVVIAICLGLNKDIVLMDEPTASLDDDSTALLINTLKQLKDKTIVSASHNHLWQKAADKTHVL